MTNTSSALSRLKEIPTTPGRYRVRVPVGRGGGALDTTISVEVLVGSSLGAKVVLMGGMHGDEYEGVLALHRVSRRLDPLSLTGTVVIIAASNPVSLANVDRRFTPDLTDLNRVFPGNSEGTPSQRLAATLFALVSGADFFYSLHSWSKTGTVVPHVEFGNSEGTAADRSLEIALKLGYKYVQRTNWPDGLLVRAALAARIASIEGEVGGQGCATEAGCQFYEATVLRLLGSLGIVEYVGEHRHAASRVVTPSDIRVSCSGFFVPQVSLDAAVSPGDIVGRVVDDFGDDIETVRAIRSGNIGTIRTTNAVHAGDRVFVVFSDAEEDRGVLNVPFSALR